MDLFFALFRKEGAVRRRRVFSSPRTQTSNFKNTRQPLTRLPPSLKKRAFRDDFHIYS